MLVQSKLYFVIVIAGLVASGGCTKPSTGNTSKNNDPAPVNIMKINPNTTVGINNFDVSDTTLTNHGWKKVFDDEFTGDLSNWNVLTGGMNGALQCNESANAQIVNGALQMTAKRETVTGPKTIGNDTTATFDFTSAWLTSKQSFSANSSTPRVRLVARIKVATGYGVTSLFWTYGTGVWPTTGEIDCVEAQGNTTNMYSTDYKYGTTAGKSLVTGSLLYNPVTVDLSACYHVYTMEWTQNSLNSYLDGNLVEVKTTDNHVSNLFGTSQILSLTVPVGGWFYGNLNPASIQSGTMYVDYVKVFTSNQ